MFIIPKLIAEPFKERQLLNGVNLLEVEQLMEQLEVHW